MFGYVAGSAAQAPTLLPYTAKLIAGSGTKTIAAGATCPVSGYTSTDAYGDGCLATEIQLTTTSTTGSGPRYAVADATGAVFFTDGTNGIVRRVDPLTGIVTLVAGGAATTPTTGTACGAYLSTDINGDGCLGTAVKLQHPSAIAIDPSGNLYFSDVYTDDVRKIAATNGVITTTGVITTVVGNPTNAYGYNVSNTATVPPVIAATSGELDYPYGITVDSTGKNLYIADEGNEAIEVVNIGTTAETLQGFTIAPGAIYKIMGYGAYQTKSTTGDCPDGAYVSSTNRGGCYYGLWTNGAKATASLDDAPYAVGVDPSGNVYFANEYEDNVGQVTPANIINNYAGIQGTGAKTIKRAQAGTFGIGSIFGTTADLSGNVYVTDASSGVIWRIDATTNTMYNMAGGAATVCSGATDSYGDGCPALQATFGSSQYSPGSNYASTTLPGPGIFGVTVDGYENLYVGDTEYAVIREVASGTQFGAVGANQPTDTLDIHFAVGDGPAASGAYVLSSSTPANSFVVASTATCTTNSDNTTDCLLNVQATPATLGAFTGTLTVTSSLGKTAVFPLSGTYVTSPLTRTVVSVAAAGGCAGSTTFATTAQVTVTATVVSTGTPTGTVQFYNNGTAYGSPVKVNSSGVASFTATFAAGSYSFTAVYSGDLNFKTSTSASAVTFSTSAPTFTIAPVTSTSGNVCTSGTTCTVTAGETAPYAFTVTSSVYTGTISFACSGLPAGASCVFYPSTLTYSGCSSTATEALSINTSQALPVSTAPAGTGFGSIAAVLASLALALAIGLRRRKLGARWSSVGMALALLIASSGLMACGKGTTSAATPSGTYTVTVTATGSPAPSTSTSQSFTVTLVVK